MRFFCAHKYTHKIKWKRLLCVQIYGWWNISITCYNVAMNFNENGNINDHFTIYIFREFIEWTLNWAKNKRKIYIYRWQWWSKFIRLLCKMLTKCMFLESESISFGEAFTHRLEMYYRFTLKSIKLQFHFYVWWLYCSLSHTVPLMTERQRSFEVS